MALSDIPQLDFSILAKLPQLYRQGEEQGREAAFRQAIAGGLPRTASGDIDWNKAVDIAARTGNMSGLQDLVRAMPLIQEQEARKIGADFPSYFGVPGAGTGAPAAAPAVPMFPGNKAPIVPSTFQRVGEAPPPTEPPGPTGTIAGVSGEPTRARVASTSRIVGDDEAEAAGLYETPPERTRMAAYSPNNTMTDITPTFLAEPNVRVAQAGGGPIPTGRGDLSGGAVDQFGQPLPTAGRRTVPTQRFNQPIVPAQAAPAAPGASTALPGTPFDLGRVPQIVAALKSKRLSEGQRQAAMKYLDHVWKQFDTPPELRQYLLTQQIPGFEEHLLKMRRAGATTINTAEGLEAAQQKSRIAIDQSAASELNKAVATKRGLIPVFDEIIRLSTDPNTPQGWAGAVAPHVAKMLSGFGFEVPAGMKNAELMQSLTRQVISTARQPGEGAVSNWEQQMYIMAVPNIAQSAGGRLKIAEMNKAIINRQAEMAALMRRHIGDPDLDDKLNALANKPLFTDEQRAEIERAAGITAQQTGEPLPPPPQEFLQAPLVNTEQERDALPPGTLYKTPDGKFRRRPGGENRT